jgi:KaiC/GvpD/RAD55 family RecA-like ATPase
MQRKVPTGVEFLDVRMGGVYSGTLNILLEEVGAGGIEFAMTVLLNHALNDQDVHYLALTKMYEQFRTDFRLYFPKRDVNNVVENIKFHSFARTYFARSIVPLSWIGEEVTLLSLKGDRNILEELIEFFEGIDEGCLCVLDSLSDLVRLSRNRIEWSDLVDFLIGLRMIIRKKDLVVYTLLTKDVLELGKQEELLDQADGVFVFQWKEKEGGRSRILYIKKLLGILPILEKQGVILYEAKIDPEHGFTIYSTLRVV